MKKTIILFLIWTLLIVQGSSVMAEKLTSNEDVYSLDALYRMALVRSETVGISEEDLFLAKLTRKKAFSVLVPELSAFGTHTRYLLNESIADFFSELGEEGGGDGGGEDPGELFSFSSPDSTTTYGLQLSQTFTLNGKELIALKITGDTIEKNELNLFAVKEQFLFNVAAAYFDVLKAVKTFDIAKANVDRLTTYRDSVSVKLSLEEVAKTDMFRAEAELSSARAELLAVENQLKYAKTVISQLTGVYGDYSILEVEAFSDPTDVYEVSAHKEVAYDKRADLRAMEKQLAIAERQVRYYRSEYWPTVSLNGSYSKTSQSPSSAFVISSEDLSVGLTVNFSLFDGGLKRAQVGEALAQKRQADLGYRATKKQVDLELEQSYLSVTTAKSMLDALGDQVTYAQSNYDAVLELFEHGLANSVDIMDANTLLVTAERQLSEARYTYQLAILNLNRSQGVFLSSLEERGVL